MELRFQVDAQLMERLAERTQMDKTADIGREALAFFNWGTAEASAGRRIVSMNGSGHDIREPVIPTLDPTRYTRW